MEIRDADEGDLLRVVELMASSLGDGSVPRSEAFFRWKHLENPFGRSPIILAEEDGRLIGLRTMLRWELREGARRLPLVRAVDTATHPDAQGRGIFRRLTLEAVRRLTAEGVAGAFNTPNPKSGAGYLKMGWRTLGRVRVHVRPALGGLAARLRSSRSWDVSDAETATLEGVVASGLEASADKRWRTARTPEYLRWRYVSVPGIRYGAAIEPGAVIVFRRRERRGLREVTVCEARLSTMTGAYRVLRRIAEGADVVSCLAADERTRSVLARLGFIPASGPEVYARPLADGGIVTLDECGWSTGDLELF
jgi:GNAT superfamily N-acetyltransferase